MARLAMGVVRVRVLYGALAGFALGVSFFFTFVVPEAAFRVLGGGQLTAYLGAVFPGFYAMSAVPGALLLLVGLRLPQRRAGAVAWPAVGLLVTLVAWFWLLGAVNRAAGSQSFGLLHGLSLGLDFVAMASWVLALFATAPRTD